MQVSYAVRLRNYDARTDIREEEFEPLQPSGLLWLKRQIIDGNARQEPGLRGWGPATHTVTLTDGEHAGAVFHARIEEE